MSVIHLIKLDEKQFERKLLLKVESPLETGYDRILPVYFLRCKTATLPTQSSPSHYSRYLNTLIKIDKSFLVSPADSI